MNAVDAQGNRVMTPEGFNLTIDGLIERANRAEARVVQLEETIRQLLAELKRRKP